MTALAKLEIIFLAISISIIIYLTLLWGYGMLYTDGILHLSINGSGEGWIEFVVLGALSVLGIVMLSTLLNVARHA